MESERKHYALMAENVEQLRAQRKNRPITFLQERLSQTEELYQGLLNRLKDEQAHRRYLVRDDNDLVIFELEIEIVKVRTHVVISYSL